MKTRNRPAAARVSALAMPALVVLILPTPASLPHNLLSVKNSPSAALVATWTHRDRQDQGLVGAEQRGDWVAGYPLAIGGVLQHQRQQGVLRRIERSGREVARAKVPAVTREFQSINLVLSTDHSRVLVIFEDSDDSATRAKHRMILLQTATLREVAVIRHGLCNNVAHEEFPQSAETLTLVCYDSQDPQEKTKNRSIALVTLDVKDGRVLRWFALGGKRHSMWFGPMFFGHYHDAGMVRIRISPCPQVYPAVPPSAYADAVSVSAYPDWVFVMRRRGPGKDFVSGDVWRVSSNLAEMPQRIAALPGNPTAAVLCTDATTGPGPNQTPRLLHVSQLITPASQAMDQSPAFVDDQGHRIDVIDIVTGRIITPSEPPKRF